MYERADVVLVVAGAVVLVMLDPLQVLHHVAGDRGVDGCRQVDNGGCSLVMMKIALVRVIMLLMMMMGVIHDLR